MADFDIIPDSERHHGNARHAALWEALMAGQTVRVRDMNRSTLATAGTTFLKTRGFRLHTHGDGATIVAWATPIEPKP